MPHHSQLYEATLLVAYLKRVIKSRLREISQIKLLGNQRQATLTLKTFLGDLQNGIGSTGRNKLIFSQHSQSHSRFGIMKNTKTFFYTTLNL